VFEVFSLAGWGSIGTVLRTPGLADPFGGTAAETIEDDEVVAVPEGVNHTTALVLTGGKSYKITHYVLKDLDETRFPEFRHGGGNVNVQLNTRTGASAIRVGNWAGVSWTVVTAPGNPLWWKGTVTFIPPGNGVIALNVRPANSATLGGVPSNALVGSMGYFAGQIRQTSL
jgi:hypothetical protein